MIERLRVFSGTKSFPSALSVQINGTIFVTQEEQ